MSVTTQADLGTLCCSERADVDLFESLSRVGCGWRDHIVVSERRVSSSPVQRNMTQSGQGVRPVWRIRVAGQLSAGLSLCSSVALRLSETQRKGKRLSPTDNNSNECPEIVWSQGDARKGPGPGDL
ncbi:hypothetical protein DPEC_G00251700 [Dallia pectoralis]|uniref:Uncharacterized protein n=1 Tax=Dallia pectoralis TaxID=75939 RepID=A0ACC2FTP4_DALPE|nr:hypothetical protein DPEC_G00251700 [Dallia pectoralis]